MIRFKTGTKLDGLRPEIKDYLVAMDVVFHEHGGHLVITCGSEGHGPDDPHSHGFAIDARSHELEPEKRIPVRDRLRELLGKDYTVLLESIGEPNAHYHIQVKKGQWQKLITPAEIPAATTVAET